MLVISLSTVWRKNTSPKSPSKLGIFYDTAKEKVINLAIFYDLLVFLHPQMTGLYIHIPFCASRCIYCGFYSTTLLTLQNDYVSALCREMEIRQKSAGNRLHVDTIYLGGGTPSQLSVYNLQRLFSYIYNMYALPMPLTQVKESPETPFFYKKNPRKVCVFGKKCVPLHPLSTNTAVRRMPTEAHRRYLKDLQYRQTVQEAGIGLRAAWQPLSQMFG